MQTLVLEDVYQVNAVAVAIKEIFNIKLTRARERSAAALGFNSHNHLIAKVKEGALFHDASLYIDALDELLNQHHQIDMSDEQMSNLNAALPQYDNEELTTFYSYAIFALHDIYERIDNGELEEIPLVEINGIETLRIYNPNIGIDSDFEDPKATLKRFCQERSSIIIEEDQFDIRTGIRAYCSREDLGDRIWFTLDGEITHFVAIKMNEIEIAFPSDINKTDDESLYFNLESLCLSALYDNGEHGFWTEILNTPGALIPSTIDSKSSLSLEDIDNWMSVEFSGASPLLGTEAYHGKIIGIQTRHNSKGELTVSVLAPDMSSVYEDEELFDVLYAERLTTAIKNTYKLIEELLEVQPMLIMEGSLEGAAVDDPSGGEIAELCYLSKLRTKTHPVTTDFSADRQAYGSQILSLLADANITQIVANTWVAPSSGIPMVYACSAFDENGDRRYQFEIFCGNLEPMTPNHPLYQLLQTTGIRFHIHHEYEYDAFANFVDFDIDNEYISYYALKSPENNHATYQVIFVVYHADTTTKCPAPRAFEISPDNSLLNALISYPPHRKGHLLSPIMANINMGSWGGIAKELIDKHNSVEGVDLPLFHRELSQRLNPGAGGEFVWVSPILFNVSNGIFNDISDNLHFGPRHESILKQLSTVSGLSDLKDFRFTLGQQPKEVYSTAEIEQLAKAFKGES